MTLEEAAANIGHTVTYTPPDLTQSPYHHIETGTITAVTSRYVFVRYHGDQHSKATTPDRLRFHTGNGP